MSAPIGWVDKYYNQIYIRWQISSSSSRAARSDFLGYLLPFAPIIHRSRPPILSKSYVHTELLYVSFCWSGNTVRGKGSKRERHKSSSLLLQQCPAFLVRLIWMVLVMGGTWPTAAVLWGAAFRICSILHVSFLYKHFVKLFRYTLCQRLCGSSIL